MIQFGHWEIWFVDNFQGRSLPNERGRKGESLGAVGYYKSRGYDVIVAVFQ